MHTKPRKFVFLVKSKLTLVWQKEYIQIKHKENRLPVPLTAPSLASQTYETNVFPLRLFRFRPNHGIKRITGGAPAWELSHSNSRVVKLKYYKLKSYGQDLIRKKNKTTDIQKQSYKVDLSWEFGLATPHLKSCFESIINRLRGTRETSQVHGTNWPWQSQRTGGSLLR